MKKFPIYVMLVALTLALATSCHKDDDKSADLWSTYQEWRDNNDEWIKKQQARTNPDGSPYFEVVVPSWNPNAYVLMHFFNDRSLTAGNLSPMLTSTIDTRYYAQYYNGTPLDSSYLQSKYGPGVFRTQLSQVIDGWVIAFETMHVGDTAEIVIPYAQGYGASTTGNVVPYSNLVYNVSLVDIPYYEVNPK